MKRLFAWCVLLTASIEVASADVRVLVVGADYAGNRDLELANTLVDAHAVATLFRKLGNDDVVLLENPDGAEWSAGIRRFAATLTADDIAILYYAGHALQLDGQNFFLAGDGTELVPAEEILSVVMGRARGAVFAIDACRNNPFRGSTVPLETVVRVRTVASANRGIETITLSNASMARGLSQMNNVRGRNAVVLFSTDPGNVAVDGERGKGSPFANAFVREVGRRQSLDSAIRRITAEVSDATDGAQSPWRQGDLGFPFFLAGQPRFPVP